MAEESWQQIRKIFDDALRRKPEEREEFVRQACGENKILRAEVESLLSSLNSAESFLETPVVAKIADALILDKKKLERGEKVGHYEILRQIGAGGMGEVYLAEDTRLNRKVALKLLAAHITEDKGRVSRFQQEAFATSALNGTTEILLLLNLSKAKRFAICCKRKKSRSGKLWILRYKLPALFRQHTMLESFIGISSRKTL
jgi:eukaryotic-like serine/threonine-protein kinase